MTASSGEAFSARSAKALVEDLFAVNPWIYWADFSISTFVTYFAIVVYLTSPTGTIFQLSAFVVAGIGLFRISTFMHEIVHLRRGHMKVFKLTWNFFVGIPMLTPSLFYTSHADHHSNRHYGTRSDGEYLPFGVTPVSEIGRFLAMIPLVPILAVARALVLVPISLVVPQLRRWLLMSASAAVINPVYQRRQVPGTTDPLWLAADVACFLYVLGVLVLLWQGTIGATSIAKMYVLILFALSMNWVRTLAAHRYRNDGREIGHTAQVLDSINVIGDPFLTECLYPVGLRYHALHHLLPSLPYHALGRAHRRLMQQLPADSPYRQTTSRNTLASIRRLYHDAKASGEAGREVQRAWRERGI